jgi:hypothetical protein
VSMLPDRTGLVAAGIAAIAGLCIAIGCGGSRQTDSAVNTGLSRLARGDSQPASAAPAAPADLNPDQAEIYRLAEESAASLQAIFDQINSAGGEIATAPLSPTEAPPPEAFTSLEHPIGEAQLTLKAEAEEPEVPDASPIEVALEDPEPALPAAALAAERPLEDRIQEHTILLVDLLRQQSAADEAPLSAYLSLAAMEVLWPGALQTIITPDSLDGGGLTPEQIAVVESFRDLVAGAATLPSHSGGEADRFAELADELISSRPMRIRKAVLCARVTGFGQYVPLSGTRFLQGRNHPVIIYTEVAPYRHRPATPAEVARAIGGASYDPGALWVVELSQEVQVYHDADGLLVWSRPEERVLETSRNRRRDFFLVNEVVLPRTLSVGRYQMKIIMRDKTSGAVDETIIPFEVVADPALASGPRD